ncbi:MAG: carbon-nitrogen hydrolase family protein, partial [Mycetocola sp.]
VVARYRKLFPWRPYEELTPGRDFTTFDIPGVGRVGLAICFDGSFPEVARQLAWLGAEVIIQPTLTTTRDREMEVVMARANAFANQVFVVNLNGAAPSGVGESVLVDPEGTVLQCASDGEEVIFAVLDLDRVSQVRTYGSFGLNRPWAQLAEQCALVEYPMFGGAKFVAPAWATTRE